MNRSCLAFILVVFTCFSPLAAQSLDSLWTAVHAISDDTAKVIGLCVLSRKYQKINTDTSLELMNRALELSDQTGEFHSRLYSRRAAWKLFHNTSNLDLAESVIREAISLAENGNETVQLGNVLRDLGLTLFRSGKLDSALIYFQRSEKILDEAGKPNARVYGSMGKLFHKQGDIDKAEKYYSLALKTAEQSGNRMDIGYFIYALGELYVGISDFENFDKIADKWQAFKSSKSDSPNSNERAAHIKALDIFFENVEDQEGKLREAAAYEKQIGNFYKAGLYLYEVGQFLQKEKRYEEALTSYQDAAEYFGESAYIQQRQEVQYRIYETAKAAQEKAISLAALEKYLSLKDSLDQEDMANTLAELSIKYETDKKEQTLSLQTLEIKQRKTQLFFSIGASTLLLLLAVSIFIGYRNRNRTKQQLAEQHLKIKEAKIQQLEQEKKLTNLSAMLKGEEKERSRIAHDLHDGLGGLLASVKSHFASMAGVNKDLPIFEKTNQLIDEACDEVRRISHNMMPRVLALSGLTGALKDLVQDFRQKGLSCELEIIGMEGMDISEEKTLNIYRIVQELSNNVLKHAEAKNLLLQLIHKDGQLTIIAEDDGKGFDLKNAMKENGLGLSSVTSRVEFLQAKIDWDSVPGEGTSVSVTIDC